MEVEEDDEYQIGIDEKGLVQVIIFQIIGGDGS